jgi:hypothetical protein
LVDVPRFVLVTKPAVAADVVVVLELSPIG